MCLMRGPRLSCKGVRGRLDQRPCGAQVLLHPLQAREEARTALELLPEALPCHDGLSSPGQVARAIELGVEILV